jgi:hypothetical protein
VLLQNMSLIHLPTSCVYLYHDLFSCNPHFLFSVYYTENDRTMVEIMEISSIDNKRKSVLAVPVALSSDSYLQWVGFNVTNGMSFL